MMENPDYKTPAEFEYDDIGEPWMDVMLFDSRWSQTYRLMAVPRRWIYGKEIFPDDAKP